MNFPSFARASLSGTLRGRGQLNSLGSFLLREPQVLLTVALIVLTGILNPRFLTTRNLINVLRQSSINGIVTVGVCWMMISGSFDLSVGAIVSLISVTMVAMLEGGSGIATTIIFGLGIGLATGIFNGFLVGRLKANPMLTTLGTMTIFQGIALLSAGGYYYRVPSKQSIPSDCGWIHRPVCSTNDYLPRSCADHAPDIVGNVTGRQGVCDRGK